MSAHDPFGLCRRRNAPLDYETFLVLPDEVKVPMLAQAAEDAIASGTDRGRILGTAVLKYFEAEPAPDISLHRDFLGLGKPSCNRIPQKTYRKWREQQNAVPREEGEESDPREERQDDAD